VLTLLPLIALPAALILAGLALCSAHIPGLRRLTGAAPLQEPDEAADFARTVRAGYVQRSEPVEPAETPGEGS
jgi:hypothetical protein